jgi:hypothetical protein
VKRKDARQAYYEHSAKASDIARYLGFAGIAVIWIFVTEFPDSGGRIPEGLIPVAIAIVVGLGLDFFQYALAAAFWGRFHRQKERDQVPEDADFHAPDWINWPADICFWGKLIAIAAGYVFLVGFLWDRLL